MRFIIVLSAFLIMLGWNLVENFMSFYLSNSFTKSEISIIFISIYLSFSLFSLIAVNIIRRPKIMVVIGSALYIPFTISIALKPDIMTLTIFGVLVGIGASLFFIGCSHYVLLSEERGKSAGMFTGSVSAGSGLAGIFGGYYLLSNPFQNLFLLGAAILLTGSILSYLLLEDVKVNVSSKIELLKNEEVVKIGILTFLGILFYGVSKSFVPLVTKEIGGTVLDVGIYAFTLVIFSLIVAIVGGTITDKIGRRFGFYIVMLLSASCSFLVVVANNILIIFAVGVMFSLVNVLTRTVSLAAMGDLIKNGLVAGSLVMFFVNLSATFSLALFGILSKTTLTFPYILIGLISLFSVFLVKILRIK